MAQARDCQVGQEQTGSDDWVWILPHVELCECKVTGIGGVNVIPLNRSSHHSPIYVDKPMFTDDEVMTQRLYNMNCSTKDKHDKHGKYMIIITPFATLRTASFSINRFKT